MKLIKALEIAKDCELETVDDAIKNIYYHSMNLFAYEDMNREEIELNNDFVSSGLKLTDSVESALAELKSR